MSTSDATGGGRPLRTAGLALLGIAAVASVIGVVGLVGGDDSGDPAASGPAPASSAPPEASAATPPGAAQPGSPTRAPSSAAPPPVTGPPAPPPPAVPGGVGPNGFPGQQPANGVGGVGSADGAAGSGGPGSGGAGSGGGSGAGFADTAQSQGSVRVYNNSNIRGLATRAAEDMRAAGWTVLEVANYSGGRIPTTTVYFQNPAEKAAAEALGEKFGMRVEPRFEGIKDASPGLIVIVTNDYSV